MKPVDDMVFQKRKQTRKGKNDKRENFEMDIIDEGALDKALTSTGKIYPPPHPLGKNL